ncbi:zinc-dependent alcohol dehydrogenase [Pseudactinotalea sp.]|uniref:zinc-dependent alcohol dehydrogenase n=1 Tax=Pseudactinotalea sp. TaxID=1926260 RepID=UPI003B3ABB77
MKALRLEQFNEMAVVELPDPDLPGPGEVRITVAVTGICGTDIHGFTGENGRRVPGQVMGHETAGVVDALGEGVAGLSVGDQVTFNPVLVPEVEAEEYAGREQRAPGRRVVGVAPEIVAAFAQYVTVPARNVVPLPADLPIELGALIEPLAVAVHAVRQAQVQAGDRVLVVGGGPIGQSVVLALQATGAGSVVVTEPTAGRRELVQELGVTALEPSGADADIARIHSALGGAADVAIDAVGISATLATALHATRLDGRVCLVGMGTPSLTLDAFLVSTGERQIVGSFAYSADDFRTAAAWIAADPDRARSLISRTIPLTAAPTAFTELAAHADVPGKVLVSLAVDPTEES